MAQTRWWAWWFKPIFVPHNWRLFGVIIDKAKVHTTTGTRQWRQIHLLGTLYYFAHYASYNQTQRLKMILLVYFWNGPCSDIIDLYRIRGIKRFMKINYVNKRFILFQFYLGFIKCSFHFLGCFMMRKVYSCHYKRKYKLEKFKHNHPL